MKRTIFLTLIACMAFTLARSFTEQHPQGYDPAQCPAECHQSGAICGVSFTDSGQFVDTNKMVTDCAEICDR